MFKISVGDHHVFLSGPLYLSGSPLAFFDPGLKGAKTSNDFHPSGLPLASLGLSQQFLQDYGHRIVPSSWNRTKQQGIMP